MNISLPDPLKAFVESRVQDGGFGTSSEFVRELIRHERDRHLLRGVILEGMGSGDGSVADAEYFRRLRERGTPGDGA